MTATTATEGVGAERGTDAGLGRLLDWIVTGLLLVWGVALASGGVLLFGLADRTDIARWIAEGRITSTELNDAELLDATFAVTRWGGIGLVVTGVLLVVTAVAFLSLRSRSRARSERGLAASAVFGAVVTVVLSFLPFAAGIGGAAAAYDRGGSAGTGVRTGAVAGLLAALPLALVMGFVAAGLLTVTVRASLIAVLAVLFSALVVATTYAVLGAIGGYLGAELGDGSRPDDVDRPVA